MDRDKLIEAIRNATNGTFIGEYVSHTLMGWTPNFDDKGRPLNCDPNYYDSSIFINGKEYYMTRKGWKVCIWKDGTCNYCTMMFGNYEDKVLAEVDLTPEYIKNNE